MLSPSRKTKKNLLNFKSPVWVWASNAPATSCVCDCVCDFFVSVVLVVPQPVSIHVLNQLTSCSVQLNSLSYASRPGETTSVFSHFNSPCQSEKLKASSWVINLVKKTHQTFWEECLQKNVCALYDQRRVPSMLSAASTSWDFSVTHGGMYSSEWRVSWKFWLIDDRLYSAILHSLEQTHRACLWFYMSD